jgi:hypothetical protein
MTMNSGAPIAVNLSALVYIPPDPVVVPLADTVTWDDALNPTDVEIQAWLTLNPQPAQTLVILQGNGTAASPDHVWYVSPGSVLTHIEKPFLINLCDEIKNLDTITDTAMPVDADIAYIRTNNTCGRAPMPQPSAHAESVPASSVPPSTFVKLLFPNTFWQKDGITHSNGDFTASKGGICQAGARACFATGQTWASASGEPAVNVFLWVMVNNASRDEVGQLFLPVGTYNTSAPRVGGSVLLSLNANDVVSFWVGHNATTAKSLLPAALYNWGELSYV